MPDLPAHMKNDNWDFFVQAKSGDPTHCIPGCKNLVENLRASVNIVGTHEYDAILKKCHVWARRAHWDYYAHNDVPIALDWCLAITDELTPIIYERDGRFASVKSGAFKYTPEVKSNV